jgi:hypothetical protein
MEPTTTIEAASMKLGTRTTNRPISPPIEDFKSHLEAKEVVIACLWKDVQKLTKEKSLMIEKQVQEIQHLHRQQSRALTVDDIRRPIDVEAHAHDTNMLIENNVIENVVAIVTTGILKDIHTPVHKWPFVVLPPPIPIVQSLITEGTQDSLFFLLFSTEMKFIHH